MPLTELLTQLAGLKCGVRTGSTCPRQQNNQCAKSNRFARPARRRKPTRCSPCKKRQWPLCRYFAALREFGVQLGADDDRQRADVEPQHEADNRAERAIGLVVIREVVEIEAQSERTKEPHADGDGCSG